MLLLYNRYCRICRVRKEGGHDDVKRLPCGIKRKGGGCSDLCLLRRHQFPAQPFQEDEGKRRCNGEAEVEEVQALGQRAHFGQTDILDAVSEQGHRDQGSPELFFL